MKVVYISLKQLKGVKKLSRDFVIFTELAKLKLASGEGVLIDHPQPQIILFPDWTEINLSMVKETGLFLEENKIIQCHHNISNKMSNI